MGHVPKNYMTDNGNKLVIGGELVIEENATVTGLSTEGGSASATPVEIPTVPVMDNQAESEATTVAEVVTDLNGLLTKLKASGLMTADAEGSGTSG